jgi:hypothetical protein
LDEQTVRQLPQNLQLSSLQLKHLSLQLQPSNSFQGVLGATGQLAALKQLQLKEIKLLDDRQCEALVAALSQLPTALEHLSIGPVFFIRVAVQFPTAALQQLQQLTYLELAGVRVWQPATNSLALHPLQSLTRLADLRLVGRGGDDTCTATGSMMSNLHLLTRLELKYCSIEAGVLQGKTLLQHLDLTDISATTAAGGEAQLLFYLQQLQHLSHLRVGSWCAVGEGKPSATAFSALSASSDLQHLDVSWCTFPRGVWKYLIPAGRQLPHLQELNISWVKRPSGRSSVKFTAAPTGSILASWTACCPGLMRLPMVGLQCSYSSRLLAPLRGLTVLHTLHLPTFRDKDLQTLQPVCRLTGLRELSVWFDNTAKEGLQLSC